METETVEYIPGNIDGLKLYQVEATEQNWTRLTSDLHYFTMISTSKAGYHGKGENWYMPRIMGLPE